MKFGSSLLVVLLVTLPAWGAEPLDALRSNARAAREQASVTRSEQMRQRQQLNQLSSQIEMLKAEAKGKLLPGGRLDEALKRSQELSGALTALAQKMSSRESELELANLALLEALNQQLTNLRADFDRQTDRTQRQQILAQLKGLRAEREQVRAALPAARVPALEAMRFSEDPSELLEQADAIRDSEDKVRRELKGVEARIAEVRSERELDGRVRQFLGDESLFDDQDRRLRVRRTTSTELSSAPRGDGAQTANNQTTAGGAPGELGAPAEVNGTGGPSPQTGKDSSGGNPRPALDPQVSSGADARPLVGGQRLASGDDDDLEQLQVQQMRLQGLAEKLRARVDELQKQAAELK